MLKSPSTPYLERVCSLVLQYRRLDASVPPSPPSHASQKSDRYRLANFVRVQPYSPFDPPGAGSAIHVGIRTLRALPTPAC